MRLFKKKKPDIRSVLFVCSANITRSPAAAELFKNIASQHHERWDVGSAGVKAINGVGPNPVVAYVLSQRGIPINEHRSRVLNRSLLRRYYWIFVMETSHKQAIIKLDPEVSDRVFVLREFNRETPPSDSNMPDPTSKELEDYKELFEILEEEIPRLFRALQNKASDLGWSGS